MLVYSSNRLAETACTSKNAHMQRLTSTAEVARTLRIAPGTVTRLVREGKLIPAYRAPGKRGAMAFDPADVEALRASREAKVVRA